MTDRSVREEAKGEREEDRTTGQCREILSMNRSVFAEYSINDVPPKLLMRIDGMPNYDT